MTATEKILEYLKDNEKTFNEIIEELDSYNGYLGDYRYYYMDDLNEFYSSVSPLDFLQRVYYGHDEENGNSSEFNPNREYFSYNGYGNLVSSDCKDYSCFLDHYLIDSLEEHRQYIDSIDCDITLSTLFDELEGEKEEETQC